MSKNVIWWIGVKNDMYADKYGGWDWMDCSRKSWEFWCKKNDVELFLLEEPVLSMDDMHIIWQRHFLFDIYDANEIKANQTLMVDADTIIHPDCPNFFNETENKYCMIHDDGSYDWILRGMEHYSKYVYDGEWFDYWKYGNSGFQIVNGSHRDFFQHMRDFYFENIENINMIQQKWGTGTDQTPLNFNLNLQNVDVKLLPYKYNMGCMIRKEILAEDMLFTKVGWIYHFNGIPNKDEQVPLWMKKTFDYLYG